MAFLLIAAYLIISLTIQSPLNSLMSLAFLGSGIPVRGAAGGRRPRQGKLAVKHEDDQGKPPQGRPPQRAPPSSPARAVSHTSSYLPPLFSNQVYYLRPWLQRRFGARASRVRYEAVVNDNAAP